MNTLDHDHLNWQLSKPIDTELDVDKIQNMTKEVDVIIKGQSCKLVQYSLIEGVLDGLSLYAHYKMIFKDGSEFTFF